MHGQQDGQCKQMTVTWHVDDLKVSHVDDFEITKFILFLAKKYGDKITVMREQSRFL